MLPLFTPVLITAGIQVLKMLLESTENPGKSFKRRKEPCKR